MSIQGSINSLIGYTTQAVRKARSFLKPESPVTNEEVGANQVNSPYISTQKMAAQRAKQSVDDAIEAKRDQRREFMKYIKGDRGSE